MKYLNKIHRLLSFFLFILLLSGCKTQFDTNYPPPKVNDRPYDIFPAVVNTHKASASNKSYGGVEVYYGKDMILYAARLKDMKTANAFLEKYLLPEFETMNYHSATTLMDRMQVHGTSYDTIAFAWVNDRWVFSIKASNSDLFYELADRFRYISVRYRD